MKQFSDSIISILLKSGDGNIIFASSEYPGKDFSDELDIEFARALKTSYQKTEEARISKKKYAAEVMTPVVLVNKMLDQLFDGLSQGEIRSKTVYEPCAGECPFIAMLYDVVSGRQVPVEERSGALDRKFKTVSPKEPKETAFEILETVNGSELQGDNLFIGRKNVLEDWSDWLEHIWGQVPSEADLERAAEIISENFVQIDELTGQKPETKS